jgi:hypothetical protein
LKIGISVSSRHEGYRKTRVPDTVLPGGDALPDGAALGAERAQRGGARRGASVPKSACGPGRRWYGGGMNPCAPAQRRCRLRLPWARRADSAVLLLGEAAPRVDVPLDPIPADAVQAHPAHHGEAERCSAPATTSEVHRLLLEPAGSGTEENRQ